ncbi:tail fiber domain-containing protein [Roseateles sp. SL47]|uniref:tail fiber domain-containing protein n=1 Tax=Roseateles sp. SL47 TaxID=2995138 RepID=UPI00226F765B|nr:tail fiber domain-containing protein [Roseateles sp. SL47]WAC72064.1 tail fiber domain-containing protein [Roseateles sp. SL47]
MNAAAEASAKLGQEAFNWFKQEYANTAGQRQETQDRANAVSDAQLASMNYALDQAKDAENYNKTTFRPLEQRLVSEAQNYDTAERRSAESTAAVADVNQQVAAQRLATQQELARAGVSPESGKSQALSAAQDVEAAKLAAGASYTARKNVEQQGYARMADAANLGRNLGSQQATQQSLGVQAGSNSVASSNAANSASQSGAGLMQSGFSTALQGAGQAGSLYGQAAQLGSSSGLDLGGIGSLLGGGASLAKLFMSSKDIKTDKVPVDDEEVLAHMKDLDVGEWTYKPGAGDGGRHIGPYAEDVQREFGDRVAPGGKAINGDAMGQRVGEAIRGLDAQVSRAEGKKRPVSAPLAQGLAGNDRVDQIGVQVSMIKALAARVDKLEGGKASERGARA